MANEMVGGVAFGLEDLKEQSAFIDVPDGRYKISKSRVGEFDYGGKYPPILAVHLEFTSLGEDGVVVTKPLSLGQAAISHFEVANDGRILKPRPGHEGEKLNMESNFIFWMRELINAGFPQDKLSGNTDFSIFEGLEGRVINKPEPVRAGLKQSKAAALDSKVVENQQPRERTIPVFTAIERLPWEQKKTTAGATKPATTQAKTNGAPAAPAAPEADQSDPETTAAEMLADIVTTKMRMNNARIQLIQKLKGADPGFKNAVLDYVDTKTPAGIERIAVVAEMAGLNFDAKTGEISPV